MAIEAKNMSLAQIGVVGIQELGLLFVTAASLDRVPVTLLLLGEDGAIGLYKWPGFSFKTKFWLILISNFRRVLNALLLLLGNLPASELLVSTFRNLLAVTSS